MEMNISGASELERPLADTEGAIARGTVIGGRFRIDAPLGSGSLGLLYRAQDQQTEKPVAIRLLAQDIASQESVLGLMREQIRLASALQHKNISVVYGMGKEANQIYIASELVEGQSLRQLLERKKQSGKTFSLKGAYNVLAHVCNALQAAHATMIHGLPGPNTILINKVGRIKVCDFGMTRALLPLSPQVARLGDRYCLSPEMEIDPQSAGPHSDVYTLGMVLYELLTGRQPSGQYVPASSLIAALPADVDEVLRRCLSPAAAARFSQPQQVKVAFYAAVESASDQAEAEGIVTQGAPVSPAASPTAGMKQGPAAMPQAAAPQAPAAAAPAAQHASMEEIIARASEDPSERWLVQKDRLDFGPFTLAELLSQMVRKQFTGDDMVLDQDSGQRTRIRTHSLMRDFVIQLERRQESERLVMREQEQQQKDKRRRTMLILVIVGGLGILGTGGAVAAYLLTKDPETRERIVYREKEGDKLSELIKGIDITWKKEPQDQAKKRTQLKRRPSKGKAGPEGAGSDVTHFGDASQDGGDVLLSEKVIQDVMQSNFKKLTPCVYEELRRTPTLRQVNIDFGVLGTGRVSYAKVNEKSAGPFHACISSRMKQLKFPPFDGSLTRASFFMSLK